MTLPDKFYVSELSVSDERFQIQCDPWTRLSLGKMSESYHNSVYHSFISVIICV